MDMDFRQLQNIFLVVRLMRRPSPSTATRRRKSGPTNSQAIEAHSLPNLSSIDYDLKRTQKIPQGFTMRTVSSPTL